jgi:hypothetical protein
MTSSLDFSQVVEAVCMISIRPLDETKTRCDIKNITVVIAKMHNGKIAFVIFSGVGGSVAAPPPPVSAFRK